MQKTNTKQMANRFFIAVLVQLLKIQLLSQKPDICTKGSEWCINEKEISNCKNDCDCDGERICITTATSSYCSGRFKFFS